MRFCSKLSVGPWLPSISQIWITSRRLNVSTLMTSRHRLGLSTSKVHFFRTYMPKPFQTIFFKNCHILVAGVESTSTFWRINMGRLFWILDTCQASLDQHWILLHKLVVCVGLIIFYFVHFIILIEQNYLWPFLDGRKTRLKKPLKIPFHTKTNHLPLFMKQYRRYMKR